MALKRNVNVALVFIVVMAVATSSVNAELLGGILGPLLGSVNIKGTVFCTLNGNIGINGTSTPAFANALVQLQCGGNVIANTTTNASGIFSLALNPLTTLLSTLLNDCTVRVNTPLASCNLGLPVGGILESPLKLVESTVTGILGIANLVPAGFELKPN